MKNKFFVIDTNTLISAFLFTHSKSLELAISAKASCLITGDKDLLILHPFRGIPILNAVDFINSF